MKRGGFLSQGSLAWILVLALAVPALASGQEADGFLQSRLHCADWQASLLGQERSGFLCWLPDTTGNIRAEILVGNGGLDQLLDWSGAQGWTLVSAIGGDATMSRWYEEWHPVDQEMHAWVRFLPAVLDPAGSVNLPQGARRMGRGTAPVLTRGPFATVPRVETYQIPTISTPQSRREQGVRRGLGDGGRETVVRLWRWKDPMPGVYLSSSRAPGRLGLSHMASYRVRFSAAAFLPWWPLRDVLTFP